MVSHFIELLLQVNKPGFFWQNNHHYWNEQYQFSPKQQQHTLWWYNHYLNWNDQFNSKTDWMNTFFICHKKQQQQQRWKNCRTTIEPNDWKLIDNCPATPEYKYTKGGYYLKKSLLHFIILMMMMMIMTDSGNQYFLWKFFHSFLVVVVVDISSIQFDRCLWWLFDI